MATAGESSSNPICLSDSSPESSPVKVAPESSPVKVATNAASCRKLIIELEDASVAEEEEEDFRKMPKRRALRFSSSSDEDDSGGGQAQFRTCKQDPDTSGSDNDGVYESGAKAYSSEEILKILLNPKIRTSKVCKTPPSSINQSTTYVVDLDCLEHPDDVRKDDYGRWNYSGSHVHHYLAEKTPEDDLKFERVLPGTQGNNIFQLRRIHCKHPSNPNFQRLLAFVTDPQGNPHHLCLLSYRLPHGFTPVVVPHGNSKSNQPFFPTLPSTKALIAAQSQTCGPKETVSLVGVRMGGVVNARSASQLPRNERQVSYIHSRTKHHASSSGSDEMFQMIQQAKLGDSTGMFVRETRASPEPAFVLARDRQLDDLVRFCTNPSDFSVLTVDPTFNLGAFDVTPTTYRHLLLESIRSGSSPVLIGPTMMHYRKTFHTYLFFAATLIGLRPALEGVRAFGTDGEKALADGFAHEFRYAIHLTCFNHFRKNIKQQLQERGFPSHAIVEIVDDVMGCQKGSVFCEGLVDCSSHDEFQQKLKMLKERWETFEDRDGDGFFEWFCEHKAAVVEETMLKQIREDAGLGCPPQSFTTNASETANFILKNKVDYKHSQLLEFVEKLKQVIDDQEKEIEKAVIQRGKYRFKSEYKYLEVPESRWYKMTPQQRRKHLGRIAHASVTGLSDTSSLDPSLSTSEMSSSGTVLSVDVHEVANEVTIPLACLQGIWTKATELLSTAGSAVPAPGLCAEARLVLSRSGKRPHLVLPCKTGGFKCDSDCANFKSLGICSHTVVVAHLNDQLSEFVTCIKKAKRKPNLMKLAVHGMPAGTGKKGSRPPRKRAKNESVEERVQRFPTAQTAPNVQSVSAVPISISIAGTCASPIVQQACSSTAVSPTVSHSFFSSPSPWPYYPNPHPPLCQPYAPYPSYPPSYFPAVFSPPSESPFTLVFITGNISVCVGCSNRYPKPATAPYDICVKHTEWRSFTVDGTPKSKFAPAYYHVNISCLQKNWPSFCASNLTIQPEVFQKLTDTHIHFLRAFGCYL